MNRKGLYDERNAAKSLGGGRNTCLLFLLSSMSCKHHFVHCEDVSLLKVTSDWFIKSSKSNNEGGENRRDFLAEKGFWEEFEACGVKSAIHKGSATGQNTD